MGIATVGADVVLMDLLALREEHVASALEKPEGTTEFHYGKACGIYQGLSMAIELANKKLEDEDSKQHSKEM